MMLLLHKFIFYGCLGLLVEVLFTGIHNLVVQRNVRAMATTYLWMAPIYGGGALMLGWIRQASPFPLWVNAFLYVPIFFAIEFATGWVFMRAFGRKLWDYGNARWGIMGLIRLDYAGYWLAAALFFEYSDNVVGKAILSFINSAT